jgi:protoporphyrin/coproporphyrin ferrochelatase
MAEKTTGVLLMAYGAASSLDEVEPYLKDIRGGRPTSPELVEEVKERYRLMGGRSPLLEITNQQAQALDSALNKGGDQRFRVYVGMRHWHPYIRETVAAIKNDGIRRLVGLCLTPYYSKMSVGAYFEKLKESQDEVGAKFKLSKVESWNDHPLLIQAISEKVEQALSKFPGTVRDKVPILFTAHSLPVRIVQEKDPYPQELLETVEAVVKKIGHGLFRFAYQSQGRTPEPWLGPEAGAVINELYDEGHRYLLMAPIGFISDHMETLYDVDILYRKQATDKGMRFERVESLNASLGFISAIADVVLKNLPAS